jgi:hypothetical protein
VSHRLPLRGGRHHFFELRSFNMALSSIASLMATFAALLSGPRVAGRFVPRPSTYVD